MSRTKERANFYNIGYFENDLTKKFETHKEKITQDGITYRFVCDHEMMATLTRYGRWVKVGFIKEDDPYND